MASPVKSVEERFYEIHDGRKAFSRITMIARENIPKNRFDQMRMRTENPVSFIAIVADKKIKNAPLVTCVFELTKDSIFLSLPNNAKGKAGMYCISLAMQNNPNQILGFMEALVKNNSPLYGIARN